MSHDEGDGLPVMTERYAGQLRTIGRLSGTLGLLCLLAGLAAAAILGFSGRLEAGFWWSLFLVLYGGCIMKAAEEQKKSGLKADTTG